MRNMVVFFSRSGLSALLVVAFLLVISPMILVAEESKVTLEGQIYCVLLAGDEVKLEPDVCPGGDHPHVLKAQDGKLYMLKESELLKDIPRLTPEQRKHFIAEGKIEGRTLFNPEAVKWPWLLRY